nr:PREDICTED: piggyBac transposable element-derived protein 4-like isoform X2 [Megachile rotundata]
MDPYKCQRNEAILWANNSSRYCPKTKSGYVLVSSKDFAYSSLLKKFAKRKLQKGQIVAFQRGKILAIRWKDKKDVCLMSSIHDTSMVSFKNKKNEDILKPKIVSDYNLTMGGVDRCDQEISFHPTIRKRQKKYYKKIFLHLLDKNFESKL